MWNNNWKSPPALCYWPGSWITPCGSTLVSHPVASPFVFLMSHGVINRLHRKKKSPFPLPQCGSHPHPLESEGGVQVWWALRWRQWWYQRGSCGWAIVALQEDWFQVLTYAKLRNDSDIIRKQIYHWGIRQIGHFKRGVSLFLCLVTVDTRFGCFGAMIGFLATRKGIWILRLNKRWLRSCVVAFKAINFQWWKKRSGCSGWFLINSLKAAKYGFNTRSSS